MKEVVIDGVTYVPKPETITIKQDIRDYCREHRVWAAKDGPAALYDPNAWHFFGKDEKPSHAFSSFGSWSVEKVGYIHSGIASKLEKPDVPWDKSLIAPDGSMPLWDNLQKNFVRYCKETVWGVDPSKPKLPARGDPVFVWDDDYDPLCPAVMCYLHHVDENGKAWVFCENKYGKCYTPGFYDHYRPFDPALVGVPRKDWPV